MCLRSVHFTAEGNCRLPKCLKAHSVQLVVASYVPQHVSAVCVVSL